MANRYVCIYKDRAAPPIGGPALHDSGVKTVQWRKRECHDSYQEVEVYLVHNIYYIYMCVVYVTNIEEIVALLWSGLGHIHILAMGRGAVKIGGIGKGSSKPSFEPGGLFWDDVG